MIMMSFGCVDFEIEYGILSYYIVDEQLASTCTSFFWPMGSGLGPNASMLWAQYQLFIVL